MLPMFLAVVDQTIVATALPAIAAATGEVERASWIVVSYLIAATIAAPIYGRLGDFVRPPPADVRGARACSSSRRCSAPPRPTIELLTLARVLQGLGGGGLMTLSQALVGEAIPPRERARYQGYLAAVAVCANTFGPVAGGYLTEHFGWQSIFLVNVPIGLGAVVLTLAAAAAPSASRRRGSADPGGLCPVHGVRRHDAARARAGRSTSISRAAARRRAVRRRPRRAGAADAARKPRGVAAHSAQLLRQPAIWHSDALAACHGAALVSLITFLPVYLEVVRGTSPSETGLLLVPLTIGIGAGSLITGRLVSKTGLTTIFPIVGLVARDGQSSSCSPSGRRRSAPSALPVLLCARAVHGHGDGRRAGDGAERGGPGAARRGGGLGAILALDRRGLRHRAGRRPCCSPCCAAAIQKRRASSPPWSSMPAAVTAIAAGAARARCRPTSSAPSAPPS